MFNPDVNVLAFIACVCVMTDIWEREWTGTLDVCLFVYSDAEQEAMYVMGEEMRTKNNVNYVRIGISGTPPCV